MRFLNRARGAAAPPGNGAPTPTEPDVAAPNIMPAAAAPAAPAAAAPPIMPAGGAGALAPVLNAPAPSQTRINRLLANPNLQKAHMNALRRGPEPRVYSKGGEPVFVHARFANGRPLTHKGEYNMFWIEKPKVGTLEVVDDNLVGPKFSKKFKGGSRRRHRKSRRGKNMRTRRRRHSRSNRR